MIRSLLCIVVLLSIDSVRADLVLAKGVTKVFTIELRVLRGDPQAKDDRGKVETLSRPTIVVLDHQPGRVAVGQTLPGHGAAEDFAGINIQVRVLSEKNGVVRLEIGCRIAELVSQDETGYELRVRNARETRDVRRGERFKLRLQNVSATDQTWLEGVVTEVREIVVK